MKKNMFFLFFTFMNSSWLNDHDIITHDLGGNMFFALAFTSRHPAFTEVCFLTFLKENTDSQAL